MDDGRLVEDSLTIEDGTIAGFGMVGGREAPVDGLLVLPGIIDLHGDAFEHLIMPRPSALLDHDLALAEAGRQMVANGITTAYFGVSYTWEPGLRSGESTRILLKAIEETRPHLACEAKVHIRFEIYHLQGIEELVRWLEGGRVDLLAFNDHAAYQKQKIKDPATMAVYADRTGLTPEAFWDLVHRKTDQREAAFQGVRRLAEVATSAGVPMASHDEETPEIRAWYHDLGCRICEFPINRETASAARDMGDPVVLGAPNVLKGGSLYQRLSARESIAEGLCEVLTSDYYYPSQLNAAFLLAVLGICSLGTAWRLISSRPAAAAGLGDRGEIAPGKRADLILVDDSNPVRPKVAATYVGGRLVYSDRYWAGG